MGEHLKVVETVDVSNEMVKVAREWFGFWEDGVRVVSVVQDAYEYVNLNGGSKMFNVVIMDINYEEEYNGISPPFKFLETSFIQKIMDMIPE